MLESIFIIVTLVSIALILLTWGNNDYGFFGVIGCFMLFGLGFVLLGTGIDRVTGFDTSNPDQTIMMYTNFNANNEVYAQALAWVYIFTSLTVGLIIGMNVFRNQAPAIDVGYS